MLQWEPRYGYYSDSAPEVSSGCYSEADIQYRHNKLTIMSFLDGHVEARKDMPSDGGGPLIAIDTPNPNTPDANDLILAAANAPTFMSSGINGQPAVSFVTADNGGLGNFLKLDGRTCSGNALDFSTNDFTVVMIATWRLIHSRPCLRFLVWVVRSAALNIKNGSTVLQSDFTAPPAGISFRGDFK